MIVPIITGHSGSLDHTSMNSYFKWPQLRSSSTSGAPKEAFASLPPTGPVQLVASVTGVVERASYWQWYSAAVILTYLKCYKISASGPSFSFVAHLRCHSYSESSTTARAMTDDWPWPGPPY